MPKKLLVLLALPLLLGVGACGDGGGAGGRETAEPASGDRLTKEEFIEQGDTICAGLDAAGETVRPPHSPEAMPAFLTELVRQAEETYKKLEALSPPEDGEEVHQALLKSLSTSIATLRGAITAYENGDTVTGGDLLIQATDEERAADEEAQAYGFTVCGSPDDDAGVTEEPADPSQIEEDQPAAGEGSTEETLPGE